MKKTNLTVIKGNELIQAKRSMHLSSREKKLVSYMVASISPYDDDFKEYTFPISDFANYFNITDKNINKEYEKIATGIMSKPFTVENDEEKFTACWLAEAAYDKKTKEMRFRFTPRLKPYLVRLKKYYTKYKMVNLVHLENCHSEAMYELLKQFESAGQRRLPLIDLRNILGLGKKYPLYSNFRAKVLEPTVEEINKFTDINISYKEMKEGRKIVAIQFSIWADSDNKYLTEGLRVHAGDTEVKKNGDSIEVIDKYEVPQELPENLQGTIKRLVEDFGFDITDAMAVANEYEEKRIIENLDITEKRVRANQKKGISTDVAKYARKAIETDFRVKKTGLELKMASETNKRSEGAQKTAINKFLDTYYLGWYRKKLDDFMDEAEDQFEEAFEAYMNRHNDLMMHSVREEYKKSFFDGPLVKNQLRIFYSEELGLQAKYSKEFFMDESGYTIETEVDSRELYKFGKKVKV